MTTEGKGGADPEEPDEDLADQVEYLQVRVMQLDELRRDLALAAEGFRIARGLLADLIDAADVDATEYADDLDRLDQIGHLLM